MNCPRCGATFTEGKMFCENCGEKRNTFFAPADSFSLSKTEVATPKTVTPEASVSAYSPATPPAPAPIDKSNSNRTRNIIIISAVGVILFALIWLLSIQAAKDNLRRELMRDWSRVETGNGVYYTLELDFSEDEIEYNFDSYYFDSNIATYKYEIVSGNQIRIDGGSELYTIEFNSDRTMMTITPALTSSDSSECWFHH